MLWFLVHILNIQLLREIKIRHITATLSDRIETKITKKNAKMIFKKDGNITNRYNQGRK